MDSTLGFYITDELTGTRFLVDTGAFCSIYPASHHERHIIDTNPLCLAAANGSSITSHGTKDIQLRFAGHTYSWSFRLAQVTQPLLGADFLAHHHLLVDVAGQRLLVTDSYSTTPLSTSPATHITVCSVDSSWSRHSSPSTPMCSNRSFISNAIPLLSMEYTTTSQLPVLPCTRVSGASTRRNWRLLRHHSPRWNLWVYVPKLLVPGLSHYTWSINRMVVGDHVETTGVSTSSLSQTTIPCPTLPTSQTASELHVCLVNWKYSKDAFRSLCILLTCPKQQ